MPSPRRSRPAFTLVELMLVIGILVAITAMAVPNLINQIRAKPLPRSGRQLRSLLTLTRAHAAFDGLRYQIRFPNPDELDALGGETQPRIEREDDPINEPEVFNLVTASWAVGTTLLGDVWCTDVELGRPTIQSVRDRRERVAEDISDELEEAFEDYEPERPPLIIEPDGTSEWATFVLTTAPRDTPPEELLEHPQIELIVEGLTGLAWMQRPFYDEELDLFEEHNWPAVLRQDFLNPRELTEQDVLELRESQIRGRKVQLQGRELQDEEGADGPSSSGE